MENDHDLEQFEFSQRSQDTEPFSVTRRDSTSDNSENSYFRKVKELSIDRYLWLILYSGILLYHVFIYNMIFIEAVVSTLPLVLCGAVLAVIGRVFGIVFKFRKKWRWYHWLNAIAIGMIVWMYIGLRLQMYMQMQINS